MRPVTDPALLAQLEGGQQPAPAGLKPVTDPNVLAQLEQSPAMDQIMAAKPPKSVEDARLQEERDFERDRIRTDLGQSDGFVDSVGDFLQRGRYQVEAGGDRFIGSLARAVGFDGTADDFALAAARKEAVTGTTIAGEVPWEAVKADPISIDTAKFIGQQGVASLPGMAVAATSLIPYAITQAGDIGQRRAVNNDRQEATLGDVIAAAPAAAASAALERVGIGGITSSPAKTVARRIGRAAATEGATEFGQSVLEYGGGTLGTDAGFDPAVAAESGLAGAIVGTGMGGAMRGTVEVAKKPVDIGVDVLRRRAEARMAEQPMSVAPQAVDPVPAPVPQATPVPIEPAPAAAVGMAPVEPLPAPVTAPDGGGQAGPAIEFAPTAQPKAEVPVELPQKPLPLPKPQAIEADALPAIEANAQSAVELDRSGISAPDKGAYQDKFIEASFTDKASVYTSAAREMGIDPDKFTVLPAERQTKLLGDSVQKKFGIAVEVDPKLQKRFAIDQMTDMHQTVQGMAHVLGVNEKAIGLGGALKLKLSKNSTFLGAYSPGNKTIILPKRSNSFAHEWAHALDYHLLEKVSNEQARGLTGRIRKEGADFAPQNVREAFVSLLNKMFFNDAEMALKIMDLEKSIAATSSAKQKAAFQAQIDNFKSGRSQSRTGRSEFYKGAAALNKGGEGDYWTQPTEMFARAFEAYVSHMATSQGLGTEFIGKGDANYQSAAEERFAKSFPKAEERQQIFDAIGDLMAQLHQESMIDGDGTPAAMPDMTEMRRLTDFDRHVDEVKEGGILKRELDAIQRQMWQRAREMEGRAKDGKSIGQRAKDVAATAFYSMAGKLRMIERRWKSPTVKKIHDLLAHTPGKGEGIGATFHEAIEARRNQAINRLSNILKTAKLTQMDQDQSRMLRDILLSEDVKNAPDAMVTAAAGIRRLMDNEFYANQNVGVDIGYTKQVGYLARNLDLPRVLYDESGFVDAAKEVYAIQFDNELEADIASLTEDEDGNLPPSPFLKKVAKGLGTKDLENIDALRDGYAEQSAEAWLSRLKSAQPYDFDTHGPESAYTKKRTLPKEADKLLENFYIQDPVESVVDYINKSVRRSEFARRFGPNGEKLTEFGKAMAAEGVPVEDQQEVFKIVDQATGRNRMPLARSAERFLSFVHAYGTIRLLPRAVIASLAEPVTAGIAAGDFRIGMKALTATLAGTKTLNGKQRAELARAIGLVTDMLSDDILEARFGGTYGDITRWDKLTSTMFRRTGLVALTRAQRTHSIAASHAYLDNLATKVGSGDESAVMLMKELGIQDPETFAGEMRDMKRLPTVEELETKFGRDYALATRRFIDMTIQNPNPMTRPQLANNPVGRIVYGITSFSMSFWRNVIKRQGILLNELAKKQGAPRAALHAMALAPAAFALFAMQATVSTLREYFLNRARWEELEEKEELEKTMLQLGLTRSFSLGIAEPAIQAVSGLKYQRDLSNIMVGPAPGVILQNTQSIGNLFIRNSEKTNTGEFNATRDAYNLLVGPAIAFGLSATPAGPLSGAVAGAGTALATSPQAGNEFAQAVIGEKDKRGSKRGGDRDKADRDSSGRERAE